MYGFFISSFISGDTVKYPAKAKIKNGDLDKVIVPRMSMILKLLEMINPVIVMTVTTLSMSIAINSNDCINGSLLTKCISITPSKATLLNVQIIPVNITNTNPTPNDCHPAILVKGFSIKLKISLLFIYFNFSDDFIKHVSNGRVA